jgi:HlyD family secretion protein
VPAAITFISTQVEYTPPVIYSNESRGKLMFMIIAKPTADKATMLHPGQPVEIALQ